MKKPVQNKIKAKKLGVLINDARKGAGLKLDECASILGISSHKLSAFEDGSEPPSLPQLEALAFNLNVTLEHFIGYETRYNSPVIQVDPSVFLRLELLRRKIIGVLLKKARIEVGVSSSELADSVGITLEQLEFFENGENSIPLPQLEEMAVFLNLPIEYFMDRDGIVGRWAAGQRNMRGFLELPPELQDFITKPVNRPYLEISQRLSELSVERLRSLAEGLLDITL